MNSRGKRHLAAGVRKVFSITRGHTGFGITLFGEKPCVISMVAFDGNAYKAGVRSRDEIIGLNGKDVSRSAHDEIAYLVGTSLDKLLIEVYRRKPESFSCAESDVENIRPGHSRRRRFETVDDYVIQRESKKSIGNVLEEKCHSKLNNKYASLRSRRIYHEPVGHLRDSVPLSDRLLGSESIDSDDLTENCRKYKCSQSKPHRVTKHTIISRDSRLAVPPSANFCQSGPRRQEHRLRQNFITNLKAAGSSENFDSNCLKRVLGFIGSRKISEDPGDPSQRLNIVAQAVHSLESFPGKFCPVLFIVNVDEVSVTASGGGDLLLFYPTNSVRFWSLCPRNKNVFILVTQEIQNFVDGHFPIEKMETLCHVFVVEPLLCLHEAHARLSREFYISCRTDLTSGCCLAFPKSAADVVEDIGEIYQRNMNPPAATAGNIRMNSDLCAPVVCSERVFADNWKSRSPVCIVDASKSSDAANLEKNQESTLERLPREQLTSIECRANRDQELKIECRSSISGDSEGSLLSSSETRRLTDYQDTRFNCYSDLVSERNSCKTAALCELSSEISPVHMQFDLSDKTKVKSATILPEYEGTYDRLSTYEKNFDLVSVKSCSDTGSLGSVSGKSDSFSSLQSKKRFVLQHEVGQRQFDDCNLRSVGPDPSSLSRCIKGQNFVSSCKKSVPEKMSCSSSNSVTNNEHLFHQNANCLGGQASKKRQMARRSLSASQSPRSLKMPVLHQKQGSIEMGDSGTSPCCRDDSQISTASKRRFSEGISSLKMTALHLLKGGSFKDLKTVAKWSTDHNESCLSLEGNSGHRSQKPDPVKLNIDLLDTLSAQTLPKDAPSETLKVGHVAGWTASFDALLSDSTGIAIFMEFLKKEYSQESLIFWLKCEEYRKLDDSKRKKFAAEMYDDHISSTADDQINITSDIVGEIKRNLAKAEITLFDAAQKHIRQLMKHDKFERFLASDLCKSARWNELNAITLSGSGDGTAKKTITDGRSTTERDKKSNDRKRRSLAFWSRKKNDKSSTFTLTDFLPDNKVEESAGCNSEAMEHQTTERSFRVILSDGSTVMMSCKVDQKIAEVLADLGDAIEPGLVFHKVVENGTGLIVNVNNNSLSVSGKELCLEKCIIFRLLIKSKTLVVRCDPRSTVKNVFAPILTSYGLNLDKTVIHIVDSGVILNNSALIDTLNCKLVKAQAIDNFRDWNTSNQRPLLGKPPLPKHKTDKRDVHLSNAIFQLQELLRDVDVDSLVFDDLGVCDVTMTFVEKGKPNGKSGMMETLFAFMRHSSAADKMKPTSNRPIERLPAPCSTTDLEAVLPDVCKSSLILNNSNPVPAADQVILRSSSVQDVVLHGIPKMSSCISNSNLMFNDASDMCEFNGSNDVFTNTDIELRRSASFCGSSETSFCNDLSFEIPVVDDSFEDVTILSMPSFIDDDGVASEIVHDRYLVNDGILPSHLEAQEYFSSIRPYSTSPDYDDPLLMVKSLDDIGL